MKFEHLKVAPGQFEQEKLYRYISNDPIYKFLCHLEIYEFASFFVFFFYATELLKQCYKFLRRITSTEDETKSFFHAKLHEEKFR